MAATQYAVEQATAITGGSTQDITPTALSGVTPKAVVVFVSSAVTNGTNATNSILQTGFFDGTRQQSICSGGRDNVETSVGMVFPSSSLFIGLIDGADATSDGKATASFISGGCRLTWSELPSVAYKMQFFFIAGDDVSVYADYIDTITTSAFDVTDPGFLPEMVLFASSISGTDGTVTTGNAKFCFGASDGTTHRSMSRNIRNNQLFSRNVANLSTTKVIDGLGNTAIDDSLAAGSFDSSGFTLTPDTDWTNQNVLYLAVTTGGVGDISLLNYTMPTATGSDSLAGMGAQPEAVLLFGGSLISRDSVNSGARSRTYGVHLFDASTEISVQSLDEDEQTITNSFSRVNTNVVDTETAAAGAEKKATVTSLDATGFTFNYSTADANALVYFALGFEGVAGGGPGPTTSRGAAASIGL